MADDVSRICLLGAESTGKTTLARSLASAYDTLWNPEYGRPYTELGRDAAAPWTSAEFTHIARIQCWYEDCLAGSARAVLFCDTDAFTTAVFHEVYLVCGLDVPWRHDGIREFEDQRRWMHERYLERARSSGAPWVLLEGSHDARLRASRLAVDRALRPDR